MFSCSLILNNPHKQCYTNQLFLLASIRDDLKYWIVQTTSQRQSQLDSAEDDPDLGNPDEVMQTLLSVQQQQEQVMAKLENERISLEQELSRGKSLV